MLPAPQETHHNAITSHTLSIHTRHNQRCASGEGSEECGVEVGRLGMVWGV